MDTLRPQNRGGDLRHSGCPHGVFQLLNSVATQVWPQRPQQRLLIPVYATLLCHAGHRFEQVRIQLGHLRGRGYPRRE